MKHASSSWTSYEIYRIIFLHLESFYLLKVAKSQEDIFSLRPIFKNEQKNYLKSDSFFTIRYSSIQLILKNDLSYLPMHFWKKQFNTNQIPTCSILMPTSSFTYQILCCIIFLNLKYFLFLLLKVTKSQRAFSILSQIKKINKITGHHFFFTKDN